MSTESTATDRTTRSPDADASSSGRTVAPNPPRRRSRRASLLLHGTLILASLIALFPVFWVIVASFKPRSEIRGNFRILSHPTLHNYTHVWNDTPFTHWFVNSLIVAFLTMLFGITMSALAGYAVSRYWFPGKRGLMWSFLVTQMFPVSILIVPIYLIMSNLSLTNTLGGLVLAYCTIAVPFCAWMLKGYFDTIPRELDEAAALDGVGPFGVFWRVVLPLARPGLAVTAFYTFLTAWGEVAYATLLIQTDDKLTLGAGLKQFVTQFDQQWENLTPAAVIITIPAAVVFFFAQRHLVSGLAAGATKG